MDLIELRAALRRNWHIGLLVALAIGLAGVFVVGPADARYTAKSTVLVAPRAERLPSGSIAILRVLLPNVVAYTTSDKILDDTARILREPPDGIDVEAEFATEDTGILTIHASAEDGERAIAWSRALAQALEEAYEEDEYTIAEPLDLARSASLPNVLERNIDLAAMLVLALMAFVLSVFAAQRVRESGDLVGRLRRRGVTVLGELPTGRRARRDPEGARRLALSLTSTPGVDAGSGFVVIGSTQRPAMDVVDLVRTGLDATGAAARHRVTLGPAIGDLPALLHVADGSNVCVAVLDRKQSVDAFIDEIRALDDAEVPLAGVVVVRNS